MYIIVINIYETRIVRQVSYLQELNRDARSTKHKIHYPEFTGRGISYNFRQMLEHN
jgi:hypothetical protein